MKDPDKMTLYLLPKGGLVTDGQETDNNPIRVTNQTKGLRKEDRKPYKRGKKNT